MGRVKLTSEELAARLPLLNAAAVCQAAGVDYARFRNWKCSGRVKSLSEDELQRIADVLKTIPPNVERTHV